MLCVDCEKKTLEKLYDHWPLKHVHGQIVLGMIPQILKTSSVFQKTFTMEEDYYEEHDKMPIIVGDHNTSEVFFTEARNLTEEDIKFQQDLETLMTIGS